MARRSWVALRHVLQVAARASQAAGMAGKGPVIQGGVHRSRSARCPSCTHRRLQGMCSSSCVRASTRCVPGSTPTPHCRQSLRGSQAPCSGWMKALFWVPYCTVSPLQPSNGGVTVPVLLPHRLCGHGPQPPPWVQRLQQRAALTLPQSVTGHGCSVCRGPKNVTVGGHDACQQALLDKKAVREAKSLNLKATVGLPVPV